MKEQHLFDLQNRLWKYRRLQRFSSSSGHRRYQHRKAKAKRAFKLLLGYSPPENY